VQAAMHVLLDAAVDELTRRQRPHALQDAICRCAAWLRNGAPQKCVADAASACATHIAAPGNQPSHATRQQTCPKTRHTNTATYRPDALCRCAQQLAVHLQALALATRRKQRLPTQQLPQNAAKCPCVNSRAVAAAAQQQLRRPVPQSDDSRGEAPSVRVKVPVSRHSE
jgi:hypothetical protein